MWPTWSASRARPLPHALLLHVIAGRPELAELLPGAPPGGGTCAGLPSLPPDELHQPGGLAPAGEGEESSAPPLAPLPSLDPAHLVDGSWRHGDWPHLGLGDVVTPAADQGEVLGTWHGFYTRSTLVVLSLYWLLSGFIIFPILQFYLFHSGYSRFRFNIFLHIFLHLFGTIQHFT